MIEILPVGAKTVQSLSSFDPHKPEFDHERSKMMEVAQDLEAGFLAEMLKHAKVGETPEDMGGGIGEEQFLSFLRQAQADAIVAGGGIGLAETIFRHMTEADGGA